jgi:predicted dehydrogenase
MTDDVNRRDFLRRAASTAGAGIAMYGLSRSNRVLGANDTVMVGIIGTGRMGMDDLEDFATQPDVEIAAVCDVYQPNLDQGLRKARGWAHRPETSQVKAHKDFREILDRKDIDAVVVATPDHWHALPTVLACEAGKDLYVEKPICTVLEEGKHMVAAARKYNRVAQVGTQQRSGLHFQKAVQIVQDGMIGKVTFVRTWNYSNDYPQGIGNPPDSDPPPTLDWDMWLGPAPKVPFNSNRFGVGDRWSSFRYFWDYAGGFMTDWGVHLIDIVQWAMKVDGPGVIAATGGKFCLQDNAETPDTLQVTYEYPGFVCTYENRWCNQNSMYNHGYGIEFHGTEGTMFLDRRGFQVYPEKRVFRIADPSSPSPLEAKEVERTPGMQMDSVNNSHFDHVRNFLDCVKSRKRPISDIEIGHRSTSACLLGNVAYRSKERIVWDVANQRITQGSAEAKKLLGREYRAPWKLA